MFRKLVPSGVMATVAFFAVASASHISLHAETTVQSLLYKDALTEATRSSPALRLRTLQAERDRKVVDQHSTLLPAAPELEAAMDSGRIHYQPGLLDTYPTSETHALRSYELGLRQQVDVSGLRSTRREAALKQSSLSEHLKRAEELQARARVRTAYLSVSIHGGMADHLAGHVSRFVRLKQIIGPGYFDRRLGAYTGSALDMGISSLRAGQALSETTRQAALLELQQELGLQQAPPLQGFRDVALPAVPDDERLIAMAEKGLPLLLGEDRLALARAEEAYAKRKMFPLIELFGAAGRRELGAYNSVSVANNPAQREDFVRVGVRIPLGAAGPDRVAGDVAEVESRMAAEELRIVQARLQREVRSEAAVYRQQKQRYEDLLKTLDTGEPMLQAIEAALLTRRVTYFEFWSEHERLHDILIKMGESRLRAAAALGRLELLTATELE